MWERIRTAIILLVAVGVAMFATDLPVLMLPLLLLGAGIGALEWAKLMPDWHRMPNIIKHRRHKSLVNLRSR